MRPATLLFCLLALAGCASDPMLRDGTWHAGGLNDRNLRAMLADPSHWSQGIGTGTARGSTASAAAISLDNGQVRALLDPRGSGSGAAR